MREVEFLTLAEVAQRVPRRPNISTIFRWVTRDVRGQKLASVVIGGRRYVKRDSLAEFLKALNSPATAQLPAAARADSRASRMEEAVRELLQEGFGAADVGEHGDDAAGVSDVTTT